MIKNGQNLANVAFEWTLFKNVLVEDVIMNPIYRWICHIFISMFKFFQTTEYSGWKCGNHINHNMYPSNHNMDPEYNSWDNFTLNVVVFITGRNI